MCLKLISPNFQRMRKNTHYDYFIGVDVSKKTLDITVLSDDKCIVLYQQIENKIKSIQAFLRHLTKEDIDLSKCLFCAEFTGIYNNPLVRVLHKLNLDFWLERPIQIKRTQGLVRGKNDKIDSYRIATYACIYRDQLRLWSPLRKPVQELKSLSALRNRLLNTKKRMEQAFTEQEFLSKEEKQLLKASCKRTIQSIKADIKAIEKKLKEIIKEDQKLHNLFKLITSVDGVGMYTAIEVMVTTNEFKNIKEGKKFACYSGVVPFDYSSGTSLNKRPRISKMANTNMKTLLHMAALSAVNMEGELREYYLRKVEQGKNKMAVINAIRNKLILRIFAVVERQEPFQKNYEPRFV